MHVDEQQVIHLSSEVLGAQLGLNIEPGVTREDGQASADRTLASCIKVSGSWHGAILFECPESVAKHAAVMLFAADGDSDDDIEDALKELADMVGKKMRSVLPEASKLSRPSIVGDVDRPNALANMNGLGEYTLNCEGRPVRIALYEDESKLATAR